MRQWKSAWRLLILFTFVWPLNSCAGAPNSKNPITLAGSTPGDELIKSILKIPTNKEVDFIRWNLTLNDSKSNQNTFTLDIAFGVSQPNTLGFTVEDKRSYEGTFTLSQNKSKIIHGTIYHFKSPSLSTELMMVKLHENIFHLLTPQQRLMVGNGGWSYTLNRKELILDETGDLPALTTPEKLLNDTSLQVIYDGRTPCQDYAAEHQLNVTPGCFKLKWRLVLNRDAITHKPTTYTIRKVVDNIPRDVSGNWTIIKGIKENPYVIIYQLDPEDSQNSICLLAADDQVLFFLDKKYRLHAGNGDFSYTLNRKP